MSLAMMDFLSAIFFIVAGIWLLAAILYSLMVFYFLRLRSLNLLHTINEDEFGRLYLYPVCRCRDRVSRRESTNEGSNINDDPNATGTTRHSYYISFGWIFRRYARHLNIDAGRNEDQDAPRYKRSERREAVQLLLQNQQQQQPPNHKSRRWNSKASMPQPTLLSSSSAAHKDTSPALCCRDNDVSVGNIFQRVYAAVKFQSNDMNVRGPSSPPPPQNGPCDDENNLSQMENGVGTTSNESLPIDEIPICSICLGPYDDDDNHDDCDDDQCSSSHIKNVNTMKPPEATTEIASDTVVFQSSTCVHQFHMECILNWLQRKGNVECPCCRIPIIDENDVWKTIQQLRKQKLRVMQKLTKQRSQQRSTNRPNVNDNDEDEIYIDETTNSETEHDGPR